MLREQFQLRADNTALPEVARKAQDRAKRKGREFDGDGSFNIVPVGKVMFDDQEFRGSRFQGVGLLSEWV